MPELIRTVGDPPDSYTYGGVRLERRGFLSIYSFEIASHSYRNDLMSRGNAVVVMPADMKKRELFMIEQPRHLRAFAETDDGRAALHSARNGDGSPEFALSADTVRVLEMPAGVIDPGETPIETAARELEEETGIRAPMHAFEIVASYYPSLGGSTEHITAFLADLSSDGIETVDARGDGHEHILVWKFGFDEAFDLLTSGRIRTASCGLLLRELKLRDLDRRR